MSDGLNKVQFFPKTEWAKDLFDEVGPHYKFIKETNGEYLFADPGAVYGTNKKGEKTFIKFKFWFLVPKDQVMVISQPGGIW